jgi:excisionase family DNA binding protein
MTAAMTPALISTGHAARIIGVSRTYVRRLAADGRLPAFETELGRLLDARAVEQFARERRERLEAVAA